VDRPRFVKFCTWEVAKAHTRSEQYHASVHCRWRGWAASDACTRENGLVCIGLGQLRECDQGGDAGAASWRFELTPLGTIAVLQCSLGM
jgi:hypothetical protein